MTARAFLFSLLLVGCDAATIDDAGSPEAGTDAGPDARREAALPDFGACPEGWGEARVDEVTVCDPTPGGLAPCPEGQARFVGTDACEPIGGPCPAGDFADDLPAGALHVRPGGSGDGSASAPFGAIAEAVAVAAEGDTIALAKGRFDEAVVLPVGVTLRGACAGETVLTLSTATSGQSVVSLRGGVVRDLSVADTPAAGLLVRSGEVTLERVSIEGATSFGVIVGGGSLRASDLVVRDIEARGETGGFGMVVNGASTVAEIERGVLEGNQRAGAIVIEGARLTLTDVAARDATGLDGGLGAGFIAQAGGAVTGRRVEVTRSVGAGLLANMDGIFTLEDVVVREVEGAPGWSLSSFGEVSLTRAWLRAAQGTSVFLGQGAHVRLTDVVIDALREDPVTAGFAQGLSVVHRGTLSVSRVLVRDCMAGAVSVIGRDTLGDARLEGSDLTIRDVEDRGVAGVGLYVERLGEVELDGLTVERTTHGGVIVNDASSVTLTNVRITDTQPDADDGFWGRGVEARDSTVAISRARLEGQHEVAVIVSGGVARLDSIEIVGTRERGCADTTCPDAPGGIGVGVYRGGVATMSEFQIRDVPLCGVQIAEGGSVDLTRGEIRGASVGACVQVDGYDVSRLTDDVSYVDTDTSIQTTSHYVPESNDPLP